MSQSHHGISWDFPQFTPIPSQLIPQLWVQHRGSENWLQDKTGRQLLLRHPQSVLGSLCQGDSGIAWELSLFPGQAKTPSEAGCSSAAAGKQKMEGKLRFPPTSSTPSCLCPISGQKTFLRQWKEMFQCFTINIQYKPSLAQLEAPPSSPVTGTCQGLCPVQVAEQKW